MGKLKIKLIKSPIKRSRHQKKVLKALGFNKLQQVLEKEDNPQIRGMIDKVKHLLTQVD